MADTAPKAGRAHGAKDAAQGDAAPPPVKSRKDKKMEQMGGASLAPRVQDQIGQKLRAAYDDLVHERVPDAIMEVFKQLQAKERGDPKE